MAALAGIPRRDPSVLLLDGFRAFQDEGDHHFVLFENVDGVANLTLEIPVFTFLPCLVSVLHEMARHAELRVFLCMAVISESEYAADDRYQEEQCYDSLLVLFDEIDE
jgi:hypothetical protein